MTRMFLFLAASLSMAAPCIGQIQFTLTGVNADAYPTIRVGFEARDNTGLAIRNFLPGDFTVVEDGITRTVQSVSCPPPRTPPVCITLLIDISYSMSLANRLTYAKSAATKMVRSLDYPPASTGIVTFDDTTKIHLNHSNDSNAVLAAINNMQINFSGGTDFMGAFLDKTTGGIDFSKTCSGDRYLIFLTDGVQTLTTAQENQLISAANNAGLRVYTMLFSQGTINLQLRRIATATGGRWFESVTTEAAAQAAFDEIVQRVYFYDPCEFVYLTTGCETSRLLDVTLRKNNATATRSTSYQVDPAAIVTLDASTTYHDFGIIPNGSTRTTDITLTAQNGPLTVQSITSPSVAFQILNFGGSNPPFNLSQGQSRVLRVQYTAFDTNRAVTKLNIVTNAPCVEEVVLAGGSFRPDPLVLVQPNGGEVLFSGTQFPIRWRGVPASQIVSLEYSTNAGLSWFLISPSAISLTALWTVPNTPSDSCLGLVRTPESRAIQKDANWLPTQPSEVLDIAIAPAGTLLAAALNDGRIKTYYPETGALVEILSGHTGRVNQVAFSPDAKLLASVGNDGRARVWSTATGALLFDFAAFSGQAHSITFSSDGSMMAAADQSRIVVWLTSDWSQLWNRTGNTSADGALVFSPKNDWLASASGNNVLILRMNDGVLIQTLGGHTGPVRTIAVSNDASILTSGSDDRSIRIWMTSDWSFLRSLNGHTNGVTSVQLSSGGLYVLSASRDRTLRVWDARNGQVVQTFTGHTLDANAARFETRLGLVASGGSDRTIRLWGYSMPLADKSDSLWTIITPTSSIQATIPVFDTLVCPGTFSEQTVIVKNGGNQSVSITASTITGIDAQSFSMSPSIPPVRTLQPEDTLMFTVRFAPVTTGDHVATLELTTTSPTMPRVDIPLTGRKDSAGILVHTRQLDFGELYSCTVPSTMPVVLENTGTVTARIDSLSCSLGSIVLIASLPRTLTPGQTDTIFVSFSPTLAGKYDGTIELRTTPCFEVQSIAITGELVSATPIASPPSLQFGFTSVGDTSQRTVRIINPTNSPMNVTRLDVVPQEFAVTSSTGIPAIIPAKDSLELTVSFIPQVEGDAKGTLIVFTDSPCIDSVSIGLDAASSRKPEIVAEGGSFMRLLCPDERSTDSVIVVRNTGGEPLIVSSMNVGGTHAGDFQILSSTTLTIQPGGSANVVIRFTPQGIGVRTATLTFSSNANQQPSLQITLTGIKDSAAVTHSPASIDVGETYHCSYPISKTITIRNTGSVTMTVSIDGNSVPAFALIDTSLFPLQIPAGESRDVIVSFAPKNFGAFNANVAFTAEPCASTFSVSLSGSYENSAPRVSPLLLDFGNVAIGNASTRSTTITNPLGASMRIVAVTVETPTPTVSRLTPASLPAVILTQGSADVQFEFRPATSERIDTRVLLISDQPCLDTVIIVLQGTALGAWSHHSLKDLSAEIGTRVRIPITMDSSANLAVNGVRSFTADVVFNRSMLWPERVITATGSGSLTTTPAKDSLRVTVRVDQTSTPASGILAELECLVLLGNNDVTELLLENFSWLNGIASAVTVPGSFTALGICQAGGKRLVALPASVMLFQNVPNPFNPVTEIAYSLPTDMVVDLHVYDALGREVAVLVQNELRAKGSHTVVFDGSASPSGVYHVVLRTGEAVHSKKMLLLK